MLPRMLSFESALERVLATARPLGGERVELSRALGRVLRTGLVCEHPLPAFDYSAMDGYAVRQQDCTDETWRLSVRGESRAGTPGPELQPKTAMRIFTGAALPPGADSVVLQENVERHSDEIVSSDRLRLGQHVRKRGEDLRAGIEAIPAGTRLGPFQLGLCASLERSQVEVTTRPRVLILSTGDELRLPGESARPGSIVESNGVAVRALAETAGAFVGLLPLVGDDRAKTRAAVGSALESCDVLVTIGGVSVGDHDVVREALVDAGVELDFYRVRIKPGKPLVLGRRGTCTVLGLPGNPVSAQVTFSLFGLPLLRALQGEKQNPLPTRVATLTNDLRQTPGRRGFYRAILNGNKVTAFENQSSGATQALAWANALVIVPEDSSGYGKGSNVQVIPMVEL